MRYTHCWSREALIAAAGRASEDRPLRLAASDAAMAADKLAWRDLRINVCAGARDCNIRSRRR
jgi:hypothetical protein